MPIFEIKGTKGDHKIAEQAHSKVRAEWVAAHYIEHGYTVEISDVQHLTSGSL